MSKPGVRKAYEALQPEFAIARAIIHARVKKKISQHELARKMKTGQAVVSRLEGANASPSLALLKRLADALNSRLEIRFIPR
ncbi:MAG: helix-turn-helix transcriptional regulator [Candidatus Levybacteria bacterium]|nr:helix-turn-helix transcriptional regulator [Candidatus Levybacteria bacterium]